MDKTPVDLAVVIPVYNEEKNIYKCVSSWIKVFSDLEINYVLIILNDGSWDETERVLSEFPHQHSIHIIHKKNEGHGPTILRGYVEAVEAAQWVLQIDSDNEIPADAFPSLWESRHGQDAVFGYRSGREQSFVRSTISKVARATVRVFYNCHIRDANIPYRLIHSNVLARIIARIPHKTFAPNIVISGALTQIGSIVTELPVPFVPRTQGVTSLNDLSALKSAVRSFVEIARLSRSFT
jgi:glycosyltransferase involved in cell wall biosynthesis